jgi:hypothetical protein
MFADPSHAVEALQAMAKAGASDRLLGDAVRELLAGSQPPAGPKVTPPVPPAAPVQAALTPVPAPFSEKPTKEPNPSRVVLALPRAEKVKSEIVVFKDGSGARSSVSISAADWARVLKRSGGAPGTARTMVRQLAAKAPPGVNRSHWVLETILGEPAPTQGKGRGAPSPGQPLPVS